jgi:hypothetical protein
MEIESYLIVAISVASFAAGMGALYWNNYLMENAELRLTPKVLKKYGLPKTNRTYSHIFTKREEKRIDAAKSEIEKIQPILDSDQEVIARAQEGIEDARIEIQHLGEEIEKMRVQGEDEVTLMAMLTPELHKMGVLLKEIEYSLSSTVMLNHHKIFLQQVAKGRQRNETMEIMDSGPIKNNRAPEMGTALRIFREAIALAPAEYRKSMEKWVLDKE